MFIPSKILQFTSFEDALDLGFDESLHDRDGTATAVTQGTVGGLTNAGIFNGSSSKIDLTAYTATYQGATNLSVSAWIRSSVIGATQTIFSFSNSANGSTELILHIAATNKLTWRLRDGAATWVVSSGASLAADTDYHVAATCGPDGVELWLDGVSVGTNASTDSLDTITIDTVTIGLNTDSGGEEWHFTGAIKDVMTSDVQIDLATVGEIYNNNAYGYDRFAIIGQSNAIGRADIRVGIDDDYSTISANTFQFGFNSQTRDVADNPLDHQNEVAGDMGFWLSYFNNEVSNLAYNRQVMIEPAAKGSTGYITNKWNPGDTEYEAALASMNASAGLSVLSDLRLVFMCLGETDASNGGGATFGANMTAMFSDMVSRATDMTSTTAITLIEISPDGGYTSSANIALVNDAMATYVALDTDNRTLIETSGFSLLPDNTHYTAVSLYNIGLLAAGQPIPTGAPTLTTPYSISIADGESAGNATGGTTPGATANEMKLYLGSSVNPADRQSIVGTLTACYNQLMFIAGRGADSSTDTKVVRGDYHSATAENIVFETVTTNIGVNDVAIVVDGNFGSSRNATLEYREAFRKLIAQLLERSTGN